MASASSSWGFPAGKDASPVALDPYKQLAASVLLKAVEDAKSGQLAACLWLGSYPCDLFCEAVGFENFQNLRLMTDILLDEKITLEYETEAKNELTNENA